MRLEVSVDSILSAPPWGDIVFSAVDSEGRRRRCVTACGMLFRHPQPGEVWVLKGALTIHTRYGEQFLAEEGVLKTPSTALIARYLSTHSAFRGTGVGTVAAHRLVERFGAELPRLLNDRIETTVAEFVGAERGFALKEAWQGLFGEQALLNWMLERGLDLRWADKLRRIYGERAREEVERNPYILIALSNWHEVDRLAHENFGVGAEDSRRMVAAAECSVYELLDTTGSTLFGRETVIEQTASKLNGVLAIKAVDEAVVRRVLFERDGGLQAVGPALMEDAVGRWFKRLRERPASWPLLLPPEAFAATLTALAHRHGIQLNAEQRQVVRLGLIEPFSLVCGGAGVGKTTALRALTECLQIAHYEACFVAVAGRAARRIAETIGPEMETIFPCRTIASFLASKEKAASGRDFLLVIDEASMLDLSTFYRISKALTRAATRLLLIGDPAQLPPIGAGLVFHRLVQESFGPQIELKQVWRQSEDTGIPAVARAVRQGVVPKLAEQLLPEGVCFIESEEPLRDCLRLRTEMLSAGGEVIVLTVHRKSARAINTALHPGRAFSPDDPVMFTINDTEVGLSNGSLGRISEVSGDAVHVKWDDGREIPIAGWRMLYLHLAYAVTVHKLQGSQTEQAIVLVEPSRLLDRALVYTAITRARLRAVLIGRQSQFEAAVRGEPRALLRRVGLNLNLHVATSSHL
jgi:exodeoxyribonuclease V alpha subunit